MEHELLTAQAAAHLAGVHRNTISAWRESGRLRGVRVRGITGDLWIYSREAVEAARDEAAA